MIINKEKCSVVEPVKNHVGSDWWRDGNQDFERMRRNPDKSVSNYYKMKLS